MKAMGNHLTGELQQNFNHAYAALQKAFGGRVFDEKDQATIAQAVLLMQNDGTAQVAKAAADLAGIKSRSERIAAEENFAMRFGLSVEQYQEKVRLPLGLSLLQKFTSERTRKMLATEPMKTVGQVSGKLAVPGMVGAALGVGAAVVGVFAGGLAMVAWPVAAVLGLVGIGFLGMAGLLQAQRAEIAWRVNPTAAVMDQLNRLQVAPEVRQGLLENDDFRVLVGGLSIPGTGLVSEDSQSQAVQKTLAFLAGYLEHNADLTQQKHVTASVVSVLQALRFNVEQKEGQVVQAGKLSIQLTPTAVLAPKVFIQDNRFHRLIERLGQKGVIINIPTQWQQDEPMKLKTSDSAA
jgi:hypothetical protein